MKTTKETLHGAEVYDILGTNVYVYKKKAVTANGSEYVFVDHKKDKYIALYLKKDVDTDEKRLVYFDKALKSLENEP